MTRYQSPMILDQEPRVETDAIHPTAADMIATEMISRASRRWCQTDLRETLASVDRIGLSVGEIADLSGTSNLSPVLARELHYIVESIRRELTAIRVRQEDAQSILGQLGVAP